MKPLTTAVKTLTAFGAASAMLSALALTADPAITMLTGLATLATMIITAIGALCWTIADPGRAESLALLIHATRTAQPQSPQPGNRPTSRPTPT